MLRRNGDEGGIGNTSGVARRRADRRRRPILEGLEGRHLLSAVAAPMATAAVSSPEPAVPRPGVPVVFRYTPLPPLSSVQGEPIDAVVASFVSNAPVPADRLVAAIDWGDGQTGAGTIESSPWGGVNVRGTHTYDAPTNGRTWVRVDVADAETGQWIVGVEQRMMVRRPSPMRVAMRSAGVQVAPARFEPADRAQPMRLRFVERRQRYYEAADRFVQGAASAEDLRYLKKVQDFKDEQSKGYFESIGDTFVNSLPFT